MAFELAHLQSVLDVYVGLFQEEANQKVMNNFPQISDALRKSLSVNIIIGCAALFTDPAQDCNGNENMSFNNIYNKYRDRLSNQSHMFKKDIDAIVKSMNLKTFRNKYVGHFGLEEKLGSKNINASLKNDELKELMIKGQCFLNMVLADVMPHSGILAYYNPISESKSTEVFIDCLRKMKRE